MKSRRICAKPTVSVLLALLLVPLTVVTLEAALPGAPTSLAVYSIRSGGLEARWSSSDFAATTGYKVQWKSGDQEYDSSRQTSIDPTTSRVDAYRNESFRRYKHTITGLTNGTGYTVRVIATNTDGDSNPSSETTGTPQSTPGQAPLFIENEVVKISEGSYPWLRDTWDYITDQNVSVGFTTDPGGGVGVLCSPDRPMENNLRKCYAASVTVGRTAPRLISVITHELAHVYTLANSVTTSAGPVGIAHLYFYKLNLSGSFCAPEELYADTMDILVHGGRWPLLLENNYWSLCPGANRFQAEEALRVVVRAVAGETPSWFGSTYNNADSEPDLERLWADVKAVSNVKWRAAIAFQLRDEFGGYCDNQKATDSAFGTGVTRNPWQDGGCVPEVPRDVVVSSIGGGKLTVSWAAPGGDGGSPIEGYKVQWKSGSEEYASSRQAVVTGLSNLLHTITDLTSGDEYNVQVLAYNHNGDGTPSAEKTVTVMASDVAAPELLRATVDGSSLTLTYGEALDGGSRPASGDFTVEVDGAGRSVTGVSVSGSVVTLTLNPAVEHGDTGIRVSYTPNTNPIRDAVGNDARGLSSQSVTNTTGAPNTAPEITSPSLFDVRENQSVARRLAARDTDPGDEVTGWAIMGGVDQSEFSIASDTGELSFRDPPDFEGPGDNEYVVTVEVTSGAGARELEAEQTFTIRVTDEREPPEVPEVPVISGETADSLEVSWSEPDNTGPAITDYDVQYREKGTGRFIDGDQQGPGRTLPLSDLEPGTDYEVQVRATNEEGTGGWSDPGEGMTVAPLTVVMASGTEPPVSGPFTVRFRFLEPVTGFSGSDVDSGQDPACVDDQNNTVFCDPGIGGLQTTDDRVFTTTVTPWTNRVAHSYTLRLTVPGGAVRSSVGSKPNEEPEEPLEVRVAPPGVTEPISSMGLSASPGNGSVRLSWNLPSDNGGSAIIRYEYRYAAVEEGFGPWRNVGAEARGVTVGNLINAQEYVFEVRAVNALGKGGVETVMAPPERRIAPPPPPRGGGGGLLFPPEAPAALMAMAGDGTVRLEWTPPASDGGTAILRYEYRLMEGRGEFGEWTPIEDSAPDEVNATEYTVGELGNGTVYVFELRAVNLVGKGRVSEAVEVVMGLDRAYWSNFLAEDLEGAQLMLDAFFSVGSSGDRGMRFGEGLRFEEDELDGEGEASATRMGGYGYRYTSRTTGELRLDYDGGESCELRLTFSGEGAGSYSIRCGGVLGGRGSFRMSGLNQAPEITGAGAYEVAENTARVGRIEAVDGDDEIGGYGIAGGADGALFAVEAGELLFREAPDYETPGDVASDDPQSGAADNEYIVVVEVSSGEGERERKGSRAIRVRVADEEEPPEITSLGPFEVVENQTRVGQLEAVDQDKQDEITEYGIAGGADGALFAVVEETGELRFREAPDYETPGDVESAEPRSGAGDNEYIVVVEVRRGEGERERKGNRAIRVRVGDEEEPPGAPGAPVVMAEGSDSLKVSWREPENRGPAIVDYEVRYREEGEAGYSDGGHEGTGLEVRLSGLEEGTVYEVQVRAVNQEGIGEWSEPGEGRTDSEEPDAEDPSDFSGEDLEGRRLTLRLEGEEGPAGIVELRFGEDNRFEQIESGGEQAATRSEGTSRSGSYAYQWTGPHMGRLSLTQDDGSSCEVLLAFTEARAGTFVYDCGGDPGEGSFRLTTGSVFVPVILSAAGQNQSFFTSELTLTNRGEREERLDYLYTAHIGGGSGRASEVLAPGVQKIETDALGHLRGLGIPIPETGNRIGTLWVEVRLGSEVEAVVRTTTLVPDGRAGLAYPGVAEEEGFSEVVYLCGLRQNAQDRSNVAFQNMGAEEEGAITLKTTVYSGEAGDATARVLDDVTLEPGGFHQYSGLLGVLESVGGNRQGYVKVERVEGRASFYAYGVINDQANSDGSFVFPVAASWLEGVAGQTLPVVVETSAFTSELTVTNFSEDPRNLDFQFVAEGIEGDDKTAGFNMRLEAGQQHLLADVVDELRRQEVAGLGTTRGFYAGPLFAVAENGDMSGIVIGARTGSEGGGGQYSVFYNAVPEGEAFSREAWVDGLQQNEENRSNLALVNTGEVDESPSVFHLEIYDGETGLLAETVVTKPIPARRWHQINGILGSYAPETRQGYIRIEKVSGENPFLAYGVVNDGGAPGERSDDGAYVPARE